MPVSGPQTPTSPSGTVSLGLGSGALAVTNIPMPANAPTLLLAAGSNARTVIVQNNTAAGGPNLTVSNSASLTAGNGFILAPGGSTLEFDETSPVPTNAVYGVCSAAGTATVLTVT